LAPSHRDRNEIRSEINVTPLVDVCLVLLIIFMLVTPLMTTGVEVELPEISRPDAKPENANQLQISVSAGDPPLISMGTNPAPISSAEFQRRIQELSEADPEKEIVVRADRRLSYGAVKAVLKTLGEARFRNVGLIGQRKAENTHD